MYARLATFDTQPSQLDSVMEHFRVESIRVFAARDGFLGYRAFVDRNRGRMIGISRWSSLAALEASGESGRGIIDGAIKLGALMVGEPQIFEQSFDVSPAKKAV